MSNFKDKSITTLIKKLEKDTINSDLTTVDYWEADSCAIGFINKKDPSRLIYVSTYNKAPNHYRCDFEAGDIENETTDTIETYETISYPTLLNKILTYLHLN